MKLDQLRGYPVVINQWASWCTSCRFEFAFFRSASARFRDQVAFLGLDSADEKANAEKFLKETPGGFPSIFDPKASLARTFGGGRAFPMTFFLDKEGSRCTPRSGPTPRPSCSSVTSSAMRSTGESASPPASRCVVPLTSRSTAGRCEACSTSCRKMRRGSDSAD